MATWTEEVGNLSARGSTALTPTQPPRAALSGPMTECESTKSVLLTSPRRLPSPQLEPSHGWTSEDAIDDIENLKPAPLTIRPARHSLQFIPGEPTPSLRSTHRRARTELFSTQRNISIRPDSPKDVQLVTKDGSLNPKPDQGDRRFGSLFQGESAPVRLGILSSPAKEKDPTSGICTPSTQSRPSSPSKKMAVPSPFKNITYSNPFSFFAAKSPKEQVANMPEPADDEYLNLDINATLFRFDTSNLSPEEALIQFQRNAQNLVQQLQSAYKTRTFALHQALAEKVEQKEELEETQSRLQIIKSQLDGMAAKAMDQDKEMKALAEDLRIERQQRRHEEETRRRNAMLDRNDELTDTVGTSCNSARRHTKKSSGASVSGDSGFESADESIAESIFSKRTADTASTRPASVFSTFDTVQSPVTPASYQPWPTKAHPAPPPRATAYDRMLKGISAASSSLGNLTVSKCPNCHGAPLPDPGHVATILQEENRALKSRITELEDAVEECIGLIGS